MKFKLIFISRILIYKSLIVEKKRRNCVHAARGKHQYFIVPQLLNFVHSKFLMSMASTPKDTRTMTRLFAFGKTPKSLHFGRLTTTIEDAKYKTTTQEDVTLVTLYNSTSITSNSIENVDSWRVISLLLLLLPPSLELKIACVHRFYFVFLI